MNSDILHFLSASSRIEAGRSPCLPFRRQLQRWRPNLRSNRLSPGRTTWFLESVLLSRKLWREARASPLRWQVAHWYPFISIRRAWRNGTASAQKVQDRIVSVQHKGKATLQDHQIGHILMGSTVPTHTVSRSA